MKVKRKNEKQKKRKEKKYRTIEWYINFPWGWTSFLESTHKREFSLHTKSICYWKSSGRNLDMNRSSFSN